MPLTVSCSASSHYVARTFKVRARAVSVAAFSAPRASRKTTDAARENEDASFTQSLSPTVACIGVADGVGSWRARGVDAGLYARILMQSAASTAQSTPVPSAASLLETAWKAAAKQQVIGSATVCIAVIDAAAGVLDVAGVGDCECLVLRQAGQGNWHVECRTEPQLRSFNTPFQLGWTPSAADTDLFDSPSSGDTLRAQIRSGDVVMLASDGVLDNLETADITATVKKCAALSARDNLASDLARLLVDRARDASLDTSRDGPFARLAKENDICWRHGGRPDDVTVVVAIVP